MSRQPDLPDLDSGPALEHVLLASAFRLLLEDPRPASATRLSETLATAPDLIDRALARLDQQGRIRRDQTGAVTGSHGLSLTPTPHELILEQERRRRYWTWCAWDAVGILAALDASGRIRSTSPSSGAPIQVDFDHGSPREADPDLVVFFADDCCTPATDTGDGSGGRGSGSVIDDWCPLVNFLRARGCRPGVGRRARCAWHGGPAGRGDRSGQGRMAAVDR